MNDYKRWLMYQIGGSSECRNYTLLLDELYDIPFRYVVPSDQNRIEDAYALRSEFLDSYDWPRITNKASVLEVLIALARKIDEDLMYDEEFGDRTEEWFWVMVRNLGICLSNSHYDSQFVEERVNQWMDRTPYVTIFDESVYDGMTRSKRASADIWLLANKYFSKMNI